MRIFGRDVEDSRLFGFLAAGLAIGLVLAFAAISAAAGGHGTYLPSVLLFPYSLAIAVPVGSISPPLIVLALLQYPAYGALLALGSRGRMLGPWLKLLGEHGVAVVLACASVIADPNRSFLHG